MEEYLNLTPTCSDMLLVGRVVGKEVSGANVMVLGMGAATEGKRDGVVVGGDGVGAAGGQR